MSRLPAVAALVGVTLVAGITGLGCSKGPPKDEPAIAWPAPDTSVRALSPPSAALVCPGARNATAWLAQGAFWNGDVELSFFGDVTETVQPAIHLAPGIPIYRSATSNGVTAYAFSPWRDERSDTTGWTWIAIRLEAPADRAETFSFDLAVRSGGGEGRYIDPRAAHADSFVYRRDDMRLFRDDRVVAILDPRARPDDASHAATPGQRVLYDRYAARQRVSIDLAAGTSTLVRFALAPLGGADANAMPPGWDEPVARAIERTAERWRTELAKGARYTFPDAQWQRVFDASKSLLVTDYERHGSSRSPLGNPLQYRDFYLRDGARVVRALDLLGRSDLAAEGIELLYQFQWQPGAFVSQRGQLDGTGQALWALAQHVALTNDEAALRRHGDAALKGAAWVVGMRIATRSMGGPAAGLMTFSDPRDNEMMRGHLLGTDAWSILALDVAADLSRRLGRDPVRWTAEADAYRKELSAVWDREIRRQGRPLPPAIERGARDWGNLSAVYPCGALDAHDPRVKALDAWLHANHYTEGLLTFGSRDSIHHYVTFDLTQARLRRGDREGTLEDVRAYLDHTLPDGTGFELRHKSGTAYGDNLPPHGTFAAMWIDLARACVLYERGDSLVVLSGVPPSWFDPVATVGLAIENAPTTFGAASIRASGEGAFEFDLPAPARIELPPGASAVPVGAAAGRLEGSTIVVPKGKSAWRVTPRSAG